MWLQMDDEVEARDTYGTRQHDWRERHDEGVVLWLLVAYVVILCVGSWLRVW